MVGHNGQHDRLDGSEQADTTVSTAGWSGVRMVRHIGQHRWLKGSEEGPA